MSLELLDPESAELYMKLKSVVMEHAEKVGLTFDALVRIRDGRLYRAEFKTFEAFCESTGMNVRKAYRIMEGGYGKGKPKRLAARKEPELKSGILVRHAGKEITLEAVAEAMNEEPAIPTETPFRQGDYVELASGSAASVEKKLSAMMEKLSLKPVSELREEMTKHNPVAAAEKMQAMIAEVRAEQYRTHSPIPPMDRPEDDPFKPWTGTGEDPRIICPPSSKSIASTELKAWAAKRRAMNDATSEDDAAWACYIAQQIML